MFLSLAFYFFLGDKLKENEVDAPEMAKSLETKDEFTMEVPVIDLKSMNRVTDGKFLKQYLITAYPKVTLISVCYYWFSYIHW